MKRQATSTLLDENLTGEFIYSLPLSSWWKAVYIRSLIEEVDRKVKETSLRF